MPKNFLFFVHKVLQVLLIHLYFDITSKENTEIKKLVNKSCDKQIQLNFCRIFLNYQLNVMFSELIL